MKIGINFIGINTPFYCNDGAGNFLLHKRSANCRDEQGNWDTGGGKLDFGISLEENVLREIMEEYGCSGEIQGRLPAHDIFREHKGAKTHWIAVPFFVKVNPKEARINEPHKMDEIGWFRLDALPDPLHTSFQFTLTSFPEYFKRYQ